MKTTPFLAAAFALLTATAAHAEADPALQYFGAGQPSAVTRAEVRAEVLEARARGQLQRPIEADVAGIFQTTEPSTVTREAQRVQARARAAARSPEAASLQVGG